MNVHQIYRTPEELMIRYPQVRMLGWNASKIGIFFNAGLLIGYHCGKEKKAMIMESSFVELLEYINTVSVRKQLFIYPKDTDDNE